MHAQPGQAHAPPCPAHAVACSMSSLAKLRELKLYDNRLLCLDGLQGLSSLHTLDISSNRLSSLEVRAAWLRGCAAMCQSPRACPLRPQGMPQSPVQNVRACGRFGRARAHALGWISNLSYKLCGSTLWLTRVHQTIEPHPFWEQEAGRRLHATRCACLVSWSHAGPEEPARAACAACGAQQAAQPGQPWALGVRAGDPGAQPQQAAGARVQLPQ